MELETVLLNFEVGFSLDFCFCEKTVFFSLDAGFDTITDYHRWRRQQREATLSSVELFFVIKQKKKHQKDMGSRFDL